MNKVLDKVDTYDVIEDARLGYRRLEPIPSTDVIESFYADQYYQSYKSDYIQQDKKDLEFLNITYQERLAHFERMVEGRTLLDIGCGAGMFLKAAQARGWTVTGVEPSLKAAGVAKESGLNVSANTFEGFYESNKEKYDVIYLKNVLEHVIDPTDILQKCHRLLNDNGIVFIEAPNDYNLFQKLGVWILKERKSWLTAPDHINYFNFPSLKKLLSRCNYKVIKRDTTFPIYFCLILGMNFIKDKDFGNKAHLMRVHFELTFEKYKLSWLKRFFYRVISFFRLGRTVIYYARKS